MTHQLRATGALVDFMNTAAERAENPIEMEGDHIIMRFDAIRIEPRKDGVHVCLVWKGKDLSTALFPHRLQEGDSFVLNGINGTQRVSQF